MANFTLYTVSYLYDIISKYGDKTVIYRGVKSKEYKLVPKVRRLKHFKTGEIKPNDKRFILRLFMQQAIPHLSFRPENESFKIYPESCHHMDHCTGGSFYNTSESKRAL